MREHACGVCRLFGGAHCWLEEEDRRIMMMIALFFLFLSAPAPAPATFFFSGACPVAYVAGALLDMRETYPCAAIFA